MDRRCTYACALLSSQPRPSYQEVPTLRPRNPPAGPLLWLEPLYNSLSTPEAPPSRVTSTSLSTPWSPRWGLRTYLQRIPQTSRKPTPTWILVSFPRSFATGTLAVETSSWLVYIPRDAQDRGRGDPKLSPRISIATQLPWITLPELGLVVLSPTPAGIKLWCLCVFLVRFERGGSRGT